jgi:ParB-like chromosome segregation protein Spo0J
MTTLRDISIEDIRVGDRYRKDLGDIQTLAESIRRLGLMQPVGITPDSELIFGQRRIEALKLLGHTTITARVLDINSIIEGEYDENEVRKDFTPSEKVAIARAIEKELEGRQGRPTAKKVVSGTPFPEGKTRDLAAEKAGFGSGSSYERAKTVVDKGAPELVEAVDAGEVAIVPAAEFAKQDAEKQAAQIEAAGGDVKSAVVEFRKSLPTKQEARKQAAETGAAVLGRDGKYHTDATDEERARGETYLRVAGALRNLRDLNLTPEEMVACVPDDSRDLFGPLINQTVNLLLAVQSEWKSRHAA